ncbi:MAG: FHA domain-containing protein [Planctomycetaceae bacterium]
MQVRLEVAHKKANIKRVVLSNDAVVGRSSECNLRIASNMVSRRHCQFTITDRAVLIRDLGSSNGTFVNGEQIAPQQTVPLHPGDELRIGPAKFTVQYDRPTGAADPGSTVEFDQAPPAAVVTVEQAETVQLQPAALDTIRDVPEAAAEEPIFEEDAEEPMFPAFGEMDDAAAEAFTLDEAEPPDADTARGEASEQNDGEPAPSDDDDTAFGDFLRRLDDQ